ncbi:MAG: hypothetical protein HOY76_08990 [Streptomyces sp.]|nr:hypothetical protein [Streptomyces sp.]
MAALAVPRPRRLLDELLDANLLEGSGPDRFALHDLVRTHARGPAAQDPESEAARRRLFDHYLGSSEHARALLYPFSDEPAVIPDRARDRRGVRPPGRRARVAGGRAAVPRRPDRLRGPTPGRPLRDRRAGVHVRCLHGQGRFQEAAVARRIAAVAAREKDEPAWEALALRRLGRSLTGGDTRSEARSAMLRARTHRADRRRRRPGPHPLRTRPHGLPGRRPPGAPCTTTSGRSNSSA